MQNRISLLFALGTCCASTAVAAPLTAADLVAVLMAGLSVGEPLRAGSLSIFPLAARDPLREPATRVVTVGEAVERAWLTLRVSRDDSAAATVLLQSWADAAILITAGEELPGCGGLVAARDVLVSPGARGLGVPVTPAPTFAGSGDERSWQRRVHALEAIASGFSFGCEGVLVAVGARVVRVELFPSAWLLSRARADVLRTAAFEALVCPDREGMDREGAERFLHDLSSLPWTRREPVGLGFEAKGSGPGVSAGALFLGGALVHLSAVARGEPLLLAPPEPAHP
ncbi:MAG: hypothetical protein A2177_07820 [Spirochaetes bacterium RBG_13_68_11]|nr:MAG: hypothetical protein A2177_07820 [Spirochaetes bacterium RBG_13_68_11]